MSARNSRLFDRFILVSTSVVAALGIIMALQVMSETAEAFQPKQTRSIAAVK